MDDFISSAKEVAVALEVLSKAMERQAEKKDKTAKQGCIGAFSAHMEGQARAFRRAAVMVADLGNDLAAAVEKEGGEAAQIVRCLYEEARRNSGNDNAYDDRAEQSVGVSFDRAKELVEAMESNLGVK